MQASNTPPVPNPLRLNADALMKVTIAELRSWEAKASGRVIKPQSDEEIWDGTEWDVRRTVL